MYSMVTKVSNTVLHICRLLRDLKSPGHEEKETNC